MADISFPNFGKVLFSQYSEKVRPIVYRTQMESGCPKQARRYTSTFVEHNVTYRFTEDEYSLFKDWFCNIIQYGAIWFNWFDPIDTITKKARIMDGQIHSNPISVNHELWLVSFTLETYCT